jgi:hypothetical protein
MASSFHLSVRTPAASAAASSSLIAMSDRPKRERSTRIVISIATTISAVASHA